MHFKACWNVLPESISKAKWYTLRLHCYKYEDSTIPCMFSIDGVMLQLFCLLEFFTMVHWTQCGHCWLHTDSTHILKTANKVQELVLYTSCKIQTLSLTWHPEGPRAGPAIQAAIRTLNILGMTPGIWNLPPPGTWILPPPGIWIWIWILPPTRNLNLNCFLNKEFQLQRQTGFQ